MIETWTEQEAWEKQSSALFSGDIEKQKREISALHLQV